MSKTIQELLSGLPAWETALSEDGYIDEDLAWLEDHDGFRFQVVDTLLRRRVGKDIERDLQGRLRVGPFDTKVAWLAGLDGGHCVRDPDLFAGTEEGVSGW